MAHNTTTHRRILAAPVPDPQTPMDPTQRKPKPKPKPKPSDAKNHHPQPQPSHLVHPLPDPPSTIQNISHRFSRLYANHKKQVSSKPGPHPQPDPHFRTLKDPSFPPPVSDSSCTTTALTKSSSHRERNKNNSGKNEKNYYTGTKTEAKEKSDDFKKPSPAGKKIQSFESVLEKNEDADVPEEGNRRRSSISCLPPPVANGVLGRRRSFCNSQVELADFLACSGVKVVAVDMPPFMQVHAVDCARKAHDSLEKFTSKTLAYTLKKEFDGVYGPAWHCIVGTSFGSFVTHSVGGFMYFSMDHKLYILLFKTTVQRAE